ncbi:MAG TPA: site-specific integrase, partial [Puia sp.]|nr:site-specific integrase [Puia sp.]
LDTRRMKKTGKYPVKLRVIFRGICYDFATIFDMSKDDFAKLDAPRINEELSGIRDKLRSIKLKAQNEIQNLYPFSFELFKKKVVQGQRYFRERKIKDEDLLLQYEFDYSPFLKKFPIFNEDHSRPGSISIVYLRYIKKLLQEERIGSAVNYQDSFNSIKKFRGNVLFSDITVTFLVQYEQWMKKLGRARATIGIKLRSLRTVFNEAIEEGMIRRENCYPFGRRKYAIPTGRNNKRALTADQIRLIYFAELSCPNEKKARDFWLFMYFGNGMNPKDFIYLKNKSIDGEYLTFIRAKTEHTTKDDPRPITVYINDDMQKIIERWGNKDKQPDSYLFPIMNNELSAMDQHFLVKYLVKYINERMKRIPTRLEIDKKVTTITSRHSFSTQLKRSGVSTEFIQEALGHTDKSTTENYLDSFENEIKKQYSTLLVTFKNNQPVKQTDERVF